MSGVDLTNLSIVSIRSSLLWPHLLSSAPGNAMSTNPSLGILLPWAAQAPGDATRPTPPSPAQIAQHALDLGVLCGSYGASIDYPHTGPSGSVHSLIRACVYVYARISEGNPQRTRRRHHVCIAQAQFAGAMCTMGRPQFHNAQSRRLTYPCPPPQHNVAAGTSPQTECRVRHKAR